MCQGIVTSLFKFKVGRKTVRVIASGIGSHSDLAANSVRKLKRAGWTDKARGQSVVSIESNFRKGYGQFTVESGKPSPADLILLKREYNRVAGSAVALMRHVKRCGKVDDALVALLTPEAWKAYEDGRAPLWKAYEDGRAPLWKAYQDGCAPLWKAHQDGCAPLWLAQFRAPSNRVKHLR
jgi:hypothetical protein